MSHPLPLLALLAAALAAPAGAATTPAASTTTPAAAAGEPPLTLGRAEETALANHPALRAAAGQVRVARARVGQADATLLPQAALTGTASLFGPSTVLPNGQSSDTTSVGLALSGSQRLFDLGSWYRSVAARASAGAQEASARATRLDVLLEVRTSWFLVAAARDLVVVAQENLANREAHLTQVQGFIEVGTRPAIDLAQARADRATAEVARLTAENDLAAAHARLNLAMGVVASVDYPLAAAEYPALAGEDATIEALLAEALAARPEVTAKVKLREAQEAVRKSTSGDFLPSLAATGRVGEDGPSADATTRSWSAGLVLTWPFLEGGRTRAEAAEARANLEVLDADFEALRQQIRLEVTQAQLDVRAARAALVASGEAVLNARERLRLAEGRYQAGLGSGLELDDAQVAVNSAAAQEVKARFTLAGARSRLASALGRG